MQGKRLDRVNQLIKEEISTLLQRELKDPRLGFVTVTEVETSKDLRVARVFVSVLGDEDQWAASLAALGSARGFVRRWLRHHLDLRVTPELDFRADRSMEHAARIRPAPRGHTAHQPYTRPRAGVSRLHGPPAAAGELAWGLPGGRGAPPPPRIATNRPPPPHPDAGLFLCSTGGRT